MGTANQLDSTISSGACAARSAGSPQPAHVAVSFGQADAVEVFADGDGVFPGRAQQVAQLRHRDRRAIGEPFPDAAAQLALDVGVEE